MSTILHSLYGRKLGVDASGYITGEVGAKFPGVHVGPTGSEVAIFGSTALAAATSATTATALRGAGINTIASSTADYTFTLTAPVAAGIPVTITRLATTTSTTSTVNLASGVTVGTSAISTGSIMAFSGLSSITLLSVSTAAYARVAVSGTVTIT